MTLEAAHPQNRPADAASVGDRRGAERHRCDLQPFWRVAGVDSADGPPATVHDVSATGIGLRVGQPLKVGTVLVLTLQTAAGQLSRPLPVRVMHATALADGGWLVGGRFVRPLSGQDLRALLGDD